MGKGDKRTGKGKRFRGTYGNSRKQKPKSTAKKTTIRKPPVRRGR